MRADPEVGVSRLVSSLMSVVLPAPLGPTRPKTSPGRTPKLTRSTAVRVAAGARASRPPSERGAENTFTSSTASTACAGLAPGPGRDAGGAPGAGAALIERSRGAGDPPAPRPRGDAPVRPAGSAWPS